MKRVYTTTSLGEAYALRSLLEANGIEAVVLDEGGAFFAVGLPSPALPLGLAVPDDRAEEALRLLAEDRTTEPLTSEEAEFAEQVRRSDRISRRGWLLALWILVLGPLVAGGPILALRYGDPLPVLALAGALLLVPAAVALFAKPRRKASAPPLPPGNETPTSPGPGIT